MEEKERIYGERYPIDEDFLAALAEMPQACGIALGFDRLVMLARGALAHRAGLMESAGMKSQSTTLRGVTNFALGLVPRERLDELAAVAAAMRSR